MGAWGTGIKENDTFHDIWEEFKQSYHQGSNPRELRMKFEQELLPDPEYFSEIWTAIAYGQWMCGDLETYTIEQLNSCISEQRGMTLWAEDTDLLSKRLKAISTFIEKISIPKVKPLKRRKIVLCPAYFEDGDVLSIELDTGKYTSALVIDKRDFKLDGQNQVIFSNLITRENVTMEEHMKSKVMYLDIGGENEYHQGYFWAIFGSRNMKRKIKKTKLIGHINPQKYLSLAVGIQYGDWNKIALLYDQQLDYLKTHTSKEPFEVPFSKVIAGNDDKLQTELYDFNKKLMQEKIAKRNP